MHFVLGTYIKFCACFIFFISTHENMSFCISELMVIFVVHAVISLCTSFGDQVVLL